MPERAASMRRFRPNRRVSRGPGDRRALSLLSHLPAPASQHGTCTRAAPPAETGRGSARCEARDEPADYRRVVCGGKAPVERHVGASRRPRPDGTRGTRRSGGVGRPRPCSGGRLAEMPSFTGWQIRSDHGRERGAPARERSPQVTTRIASGPTPLLFGRLGLFYMCVPGGSIVALANEPCDVVRIPLGGIDHAFWIWRLADRPGAQSDGGVGPRLRARASAQASAMYPMHVLTRVQNDGPKHLEGASLRRRGSRGPSHVGNKGWNYPRSRELR